MVAVLVALLLTSAAPARAQDATAALRARFTGDEVWMLAVVLSDPDQARAFGSQAAAAGDEAAKRDFEMRWRKRIVEFANAYHEHLTTRDIVPHAPSVEQMVDDWEHAVTSYHISAMPEDKRTKSIRDISEGNAFLGLMRGTVEKRVREKRRKTADDMERYLLTPGAVAAEQYVPKPAAALETARHAAGDGQAAQHARTPEEATRRTGEVFNGTPPKPGDVAPPVDATKPPSPGPATPAVPAAAPSPAGGSLVAPLTAESGGFKVTAPPSPAQGRDANAPKTSAWKVIAKKAAPTVGGGLFGALLGFLVAGPIGALIGAAIGAAAGHAAGKTREDATS